MLNTNNNHLDFGNFILVAIFVKNKNIMKKLYYLSIAALALGSTSVNAQKLHQPAKAVTMKAESAISSRPITNAKPSFQSKNLNILWEEDFETTGAGGAGFLFSTDNGNYVGDGADSAYWSSTSASTIPINNNASEMNGQYLRWNSYTANANEPGIFASTPVIGAIRTPAIDLSTASSNEISMSFNSATIFCCSPSSFPWSISVSTDGGTTFSAPIDLDFGIDRNVFSNIYDAPTNIKMDISSLLDANPINNNDVVVEFKWTGNIGHTYTSGQTQYNTHYYWDIDDIRIYETPEYDLRLTRAWTNDINQAYEYSEIPQSLAGNLTVQASVVNYGSEIPTGVAIAVDVLNSGGTSVAQATGGSLSQNFNTAEDTVTFATSIDLSALAVGTYTIVYEIVMDQTDEDVSDNVRTRTLRITNNTYAAYNADLSVRAESPGYFYSEAQGSSDPADWGNLYFFNQNVTLHGVELAVHPGLQGALPPAPTTVNEPIQISVYQSTATDLVEIAGPYEYTVNSAMISSNANRHLFSFYDTDPGSFSGPAQLEAGELYLIAFTHFGGPGLHFFFWGTPLDEDVSLRFRLPEDGPNWYIGPLDEPVMALNFDETLNVGETEMNGFNFAVYPNPAGDFTNIQFNLEAESNVSVEIRDLSGKLVLSNNYNSMGIGNNTIKIDTENLRSGMYICSLVTNGSKASKKLVIK
jgi:hypothetical protein